MKEIGYALLAVLLMAGCGVDSGEKKTPAAEDIPAAQEIKVHEIPEASEALYHKAAQAYGKGHRTEALRLANQAINEDGENYKALSLKGIILAFDISPDEGIPFIEKALSISPSYVQADYDMAVAQKLGRHYDESIVYFQKVLKADPQNTWSYYGIATNFADKKDRKQALDYLEKAVLLGGQDVVSAASVQDHFAFLREDAEFKRILQMKQE